MRTSGSSRRWWVKWLATGLFVCALPVGWGQTAVEELSSPEELFQYAQGLQKRQLLDLAMEQYAQLISKYATHPLAADAECNVLLCLRDLKKQPELLQGIQAFRKKYPSHPQMEALNNLEAELHFERQEYDLAIGSYRRLMTSSSSEPLREQAAFYLGLSLWHQAGKATPEAMKLLVDLSRKPLDQTRPWRGAALYHVSWQALTGPFPQLEEAEKGFEKLSVSSGVSEEWRSRACEGLGDVRQEKGDAQGALQTYEQCLKQFPNGANSRSVRKKRVRLLYLEKKYQEALVLAESWSSLYGGEQDSEIDLIRGDCLFVEGRFNQARAFFEAVSEREGILDEWREKALVRVIECDVAMKSWDVAGVQIRSWLAQYPKSSEKWRMLCLKGDVLKSQGHVLEAEDQYRQAQALCIGTVRNQLEVGQRLMALYEESGMAEQAAKVCMEIARMKDVPSPGAYWIRAVYDMKQAGKPEEAIKIHRVILKECASDVALIRQCRRDLLGLLSDQGDYAGAEEQVRILLAEGDGVGDPAEAVNLKMGLATLLYNQGKRAEAIAMLKEELGGKGGLSQSASQDIQALCVRMSLMGQGASVPERSERLGGLKMLGELLRQKAQVAFSAEFLYYAGSVCQEIRASGIGWEADFDGVSCEKMIWTAVWGMAEPSSLPWRCRAGVALAKLLQEEGKAPLAESQAIVMALERLLPQAAAVVPESERPLFQSELDALRASYYEQVGQHTKALDLSDQVLRLGGQASKEARALAWLISARILYTVNDMPREALKAAMKCYIIGNQEKTNPEAVALAIRINHSLKVDKETRELWKELQSRYPLKAAELEKDPDLQDLFRENEKKE